MGQTGATPNAAAVASDSIGHYDGDRLKDFETIRAAVWATRETLRRVAE